MTYKTEEKLSMTSISLLTFETVCAAYETRIAAYKARIAELEEKVSQFESAAAVSSESSQSSGIEFDEDVIIEDDNDVEEVPVDIAEPVEVPKVQEAVVEEAKKFAFKSPEWFKACKITKTALHHLGKIEDITQWRKWSLECNHISNSQKAGRLGYIIAWTPHTVGLSQADADEASVCTSRISKNISTGAERADAKTEAEHLAENKIVADRIAKLHLIPPASLKFLHVFGGLLAPRRIEPHSLVILDKASDDAGTENVYIKETADLIWRKYKTDSGYGEQKFNLREECLVNTESDRNLAMGVLNAIPAGRAFPSSENAYTQAMKREFGVCNNSIRHHWSSKFRAEESMPAFRRCCQLLAHSPSTAILHYAS